MSSESTCKYHYKHSCIFLKAKFALRLLFFVLMGLLLNFPAVRELFTAEERNHILLMSVFCSVYYGPYFLSTPLACRWSTFSALQVQLFVLGLPRTTSN